MCFAQGSTDHMTAQCTMCNLFPPTSQRCPHLPLSVCKNTTNHPRIQVVHFKNAEIGTFNGCGYCKYARQKPFANIEHAWQNPGWPGCCRAPKLNEIHWIPPHDWHAVSRHHSIAIPDQIIDKLEKERGGGPGGVTPPASPEQRRRGHLPNTAAPEMTRSSSGSQNMSRSHGGSLSRSSTITMPMTIPRGGERERERERRDEMDAAPSSLEAYTNAPRTSRPAPSGSLPTSSPLDHYQPRSSKDSGPASKEPGRKPSLALLSPQRPSAATISSGIAANIRDQERQPPKRASTQPTPQQSPPMMYNTNPMQAPGMVRRSSDSFKGVPPIMPAPAHPRQLADDFARMRLGVTTRAQESPLRKSSTGAGTDSDSTGTLTSTGGFTDYLSDESEAEIQRLAEERAARQEERRLEEREFGDARNMIKNAGLKPPKEWQQVTSLQPRGGGSSLRKSPQNPQQPLQHSNQQQPAARYPPAHMQSISQNPYGGLMQTVQGGPPRMANPSMYSGYPQQQPQPQPQPQPVYKRR